jgi:hypothetical protein
MEIFLEWKWALGEILRAERNFSLLFLINSTREITRQRKIPLRAQNSAYTAKNAEPVAQQD